MSAAVSTWIGKKLGNSPYRILRGLSAGGMALVYLAEDIHDGRQVVVKSPRPDAKDPTLADRFGDEIRAMALLRHPHIVPLLDSGEHEGNLFLVLPFFDGGSLLERWRGKDAPAIVYDLPSWLPAIASALDFLHIHGWLHRDVKPANILYDSSGTSHLADFGLSKVYAGPPDRGLTRLGSPAPGTPRYMSPEMLTAEPADGRADQFSLAVLLYEGLTGQCPFPGDSPSAVLRSQALGNPAPAHRVHVALPPALSAILAKGMALRPEHRYATCVEFTQEVLTALNVAAPTTPCVSGQSTWSISDIPPVPFEMPAEVAAPSVPSSRVPTPMPMQPSQAWSGASHPSYPMMQAYPPLPSGPGKVGRFVRAVVWLALGLVIGGLILPGSPLHRAVADPFCQWMEEKAGWTLPWAHHKKQLDAPTLAGAGEDKLAALKELEEQLSKTRGDLGGARRSLESELIRVKELEAAALTHLSDLKKAEGLASDFEAKAAKLAKENEKALADARSAQKKLITLGGDLGNVRREADSLRTKAAAAEAARVEIVGKATKAHAKIKPWFGLMNPNGGAIIFEVRAMHWDGAWSEWSRFTLEANTNGVYYTPNAIWMQVRFDNIGGDGKTTYCDPIDILPQVFPIDSNPGFSEVDARYRFEWQGSLLRMFRASR